MCDDLFVPVGVMPRLPPATIRRPPAFPFSRCCNDERDGEHRSHARCEHQPADNRGDGFPRAGHINSRSSKAGLVNLFECLTLTKSKGFLPRCRIVDWGVVAWVKSILLRSRLRQFPSAARSFSRPGAMAAGGRFRWTFFALPRPARFERSPITMPPMRTLLSSPPTSITPPRLERLTWGAALQSSPPTNL